MAEPGLGGLVVVADHLARLDRADRHHRAGGEGDATVRIAAVRGPRQQGVEDVTSVPMLHGVAVPLWAPLDLVEAEDHIAGPVGAGRAGRRLAGLLALLRRWRR